MTLQCGAMTSAAPGPDDESAPLGVTAVYTSQVARQAGLPGAELFDAPPARVVFAIVRAFLWVGRLLDRRHAPLAPSVLHRLALIDALLQRAGARRVLELACGLSRRGVALTADPRVDVVQVDLPPIVRARAELLGRTEAGRAVLARPNLRTVAADVATVDLGAVAPAGPDLFVVAEGLLMYLDAQAQASLWRRVCTLLRARGGGTLIFDLVPAVEQPAPGRVGRALGWLMRRVTRGQGFVRDQRTRADIEAELAAIGFSEVRWVEPASVAAAWSLPMPQVRTQQLVWVCRVAVG